LPVIGSSRQSSQLNSWQYKSQLQSHIMHSSKGAKASWPNETKQNKSKKPQFLRAPTRQPHCLQTLPTVSSAKCVTSSMDGHSFRPVDHLPGVTYTIQKVILARKYPIIWSLNDSMSCLLVSEQTTIPNRECNFSEFA